MEKRVHACTDNQGTVKLEHFPLPPHPCYNVVSLVVLGFPWQATNIVRWGGGEDNEKFKKSLDRAHQYNNAGNTNTLAEVVPINYSMIVPSKPLHQQTTATLRNLILSPHPNGTAYQQPGTTINNLAYGNTFTEQPSTEHLDPTQNAFIPKAQNHSTDPTPNTMARIFSSWPGENLLQIRFRNLTTIQETTAAGETHLRA